MADRHTNFDGKSLREVADMLADSGSESDLAYAARAEFLMRQTQFQERAATAAEETSRHTRRYTLYMLRSVVILAVSAFGSLLLEFWRFTYGK